MNQIDVFGGIVIGISVSMTAVYLNWLVKEKYGEEYAFGYHNTEIESNIFKPREEIRETARQVVDSIEWSPRTVWKGITNINFTHEGTEYRAVLTVETMEHFKETKNEKEY